MAKHVVLVISLILQVFQTQGQFRDSVVYSNYFEWDQGYGLHQEKGDFELTVELQGDSLLWSADARFPSNKSLVLSSDRNHIAAFSNDVEMVFYHKREQQLFYLIKWENTYTAYGVGKGELAIEEALERIILLLNKGTGLEGVAEFLERQAVYDF
ncbi:MAG: hypothetical protein AAF789_05475 [Bacteroidota bacterium]